MWIITKQGLFNTDELTFIGEEPLGTFALCGSNRYFVSERRVTHKIAAALKNNEKFLEIE